MAAQEGAFMGGKKDAGILPDADELKKNPAMRILRMIALCNGALMAARGPAVKAAGFSDKLVRGAAQEMAEKF